MDSRTEVGDAPAGLAPSAAPVSGLGSVSDTAPGATRATPESDDAAAGPAAAPPAGEQGSGAPGGEVLPSGSGSSAAELVAAAARSVGAVRVASLDADAALSVVLAARHAAAAVFAVEAEALHRLGSVYPDSEALGGLDEDQAVVFELMAALGVAQRSAANRLAQAGRLADVPGLCAALRHGLLDVPAALVVLEAMAGLEPELQREAVERLLAAHAQMPGGLSRAQLSRLIRRIAALLDPDRAEEEQADAARGRRVWFHRGGRAGEEASLGMTGPAERVALCSDTIDALARAILEHARRARADHPDDTGAEADPGAKPAMGGSEPVCPPSATLEQARFDALDWLITGRTAASHPAWLAGERPDDAPEPDGAVEPGSAVEPDETAEPGQTPEGAEAGESDDMAEPAETADDDAHADRGSSSAGDSSSEGGPFWGGDAPSGETPAGRYPATRRTTAPSVGAAPGEAGVFARPGGCGCGRPRVSVVAQVTLSMATLLNLDDAPGELDGHGGIPASVARDLAASATVWRRLLTDPVDGHLVTQEIKSYRPSLAMRRFVDARSNGVCASRGCAARVDLQIDHDTAWPHGPTSVTNEALLHQPHHAGKTCGAWCHELHPETGELTQTSPLGRAYTTRPLPPLGGDLVGGPPDPAELRERRATRSALRRRLRGLDALDGDPPDMTSPPAPSPLERHLAGILATADP